MRRFISCLVCLFCFFWERIERGVETTYLLPCEPLEDDARVGANLEVVNRIIVSGSSRCV
jgi:hypothetical protein